MGCPLPKYIKEERRRRPTLTGSRIPSLSLVWTRRGRKEEGKGKERERKGVATPFPLSNSDQKGRGRSQPFEAFPLFPLKPIKAPCFPVTTRYSENTRITRNLSDVRI